MLQRNCIGSKDDADAACEPSITGEVNGTQNDLDLLFPFQVCQSQGMVETNMHDGSNGGGGFR